jgi:hypothetical protein
MLLSFDQDVAKHMKCDCATAVGNLKGVRSYRFAQHRQCYHTSTDKRIHWCKRWTSGRPGNRSTSSTQWLRNSIQSRAHWKTEMRRGLSLVWKQSQLYLHVRYPWGSNCNILRYEFSRMVSSGKNVLSHGYAIVHTDILLRHCTHRKLVWLLKSQDAALNGDICSCWYETNVWPCQVPIVQVMDFSGREMHCSLLSGCDLRDCSGHVMSQSLTCYACTG